MSASLQTLVRTRSERERITRQHARSTMAMQEPILMLAKLLDVVRSGRLGHCVIRSRSREEQ
jgi:hypothetical protein